MHQRHATPRHILAYAMIIVLLTPLIRPTGTQAYSGPTYTPTPTATSYAQKTLVLQQGVRGYLGSQDVEIRAAEPNTVQSGATMAVGGMDELATLIQFDLDDMLTGEPALRATTIVEATLSLYANSRAQSTAMDMSAYVVRRGWQETQATWNRATKFVTWTVPGCNGTAKFGDRSGTATDTVKVGKVGSWVNIDLTEAVRDWVSNPSSNHGVVLKANTRLQAYAFVASEVLGWEHRPKLEIVYQVPATATLTPTATKTSTGKPPTNTPTRTATSTATATPHIRYLPLIMRQADI